MLHPTGWSTTPRAACGIWWKSELSMDGTPAGYGVHRGGRQPGENGCTRVLDKAGWVASVLRLSCRKQRRLSRRHPANV
ncbi:MAG: hypothetical protein ACLUVY_05575 [Bacteroides uniformis]